jgi:hypothetical protein
MTPAQKKWTQILYVAKRECQLQDRLELVLTYLEDGATETAGEILRQLLQRGNT